MNTAPIRGRAVVIGAGMAGLLAARVLAERFGEVVVLDKDRLPADAAPRRGVPQGRHVHFLLATGQRIIEGHFPGFTRDLLERGAALARGGVFVNGGYILPPAFSPGLTASRPLVEHVVRRHLLALPNVRLLPGTAAGRLRATPDGARVTGVVVSAAAGDAGSRAEVGADLVIDATGRGSRAAAWLGALGYDAPIEEKIDLPISYAARVFRRGPADLAGGATFEFVATGQTCGRGGAMVAVEGERWIVSLCGYGDQVPPRDRPGFVAFARSLPAPRIGEFLESAEPLDDEGCAMRFPGSLRRRWDRLARLPAGFLVVGDGLCSFNPVFGQGMTVAAQQSLALAEALRGGSPEGLARRFHRAAVRATDTPWAIAAGADLQHPAAVGRRPPLAKYLAAYAGRVQKAAHRDPVVAARWLALTLLTVPPGALLSPGIAVRVLRDGVGRAVSSPRGRRET